MTIGRAHELYMTAMRQRRASRANRPTSAGRSGRSRKSIIGILRPCGEAWRRYRIGVRLRGFVIFPLVMSARLMRGRKQSLIRSTLRMPFYAQCYPASVFAPGLSSGITVGTLYWQASRTAGRQES